MILLALQGYHRLATRRTDLLSTPVCDAGICVRNSHTRKFGSLRRKRVPMPIISESHKTRATL